MPLHTCQTLFHVSKFKIRAEVSFQVALQIHTSTVNGKLGILSYYHHKA